MTTREKQIGRRIKKLREVVSLTSQQALADALSKAGHSITRQSIALWEGGKGIPSWEVMPTLAMVLKTEEEFILFGISKKNVGSKDERYLAYISEMEGQLLTAFRTATEEGQAAILAAASAVAAKAEKQANVVELRTRRKA